MSEAAAGSDPGREELELSERADVLDALLSGRRTPEDALHVLGAYSWDSEVLVHVRPEHLLAVLRRLRDGEIGPAEVEEWANAIEMRDDIGFDADSEHVVRDVLHTLANPDLVGALTVERSQELIGALARLSSQ